MTQPTYETAETAFQLFVEAYGRAWAPRSILKHAHDPIEVAATGLEEKLPTPRPERDTDGGELAT